MKTITLSQLTTNGACDSQVELFKTMFRESVEVTPELAVTVAGKFDWNWAADNLLSESAQKACYEATAPAREAYDEATASAWRAYDEAKESAWKACYEARASAWRAYNEATASAWKAYDEAIASAFATAYIND